MGTVAKEYYHLVEATACLYTTQHGHVKVLLVKNEEEPYKGYWVLPRKYVNDSQTCYQTIYETLVCQFHFNHVYLEETFSNSNPKRLPNESLISINYLGFVNDYELEKHTEELNMEAKWFDIQELPKIGYDYQDTLDMTKQRLKEKLLSSEILKQFFPSDFTLPEIQKVYDSILDKKFDRRNFRKKFISLGLIEDTNDYDIKGTGRPAKLYRFKENIEIKKLF